MLDTENAARRMVRMNDPIATYQAALLEVPEGTTRVVGGIAVTRWSRHAFEVGTWGTDNVVGSEHAAEQIVEAA